MRRVTTTLTATSPSTRPPDEAARLVQKLNSLVDGDQAVAELIACGPPALEPLRKFLFESKPSVVYQPRRWAVEALGGLRAKDTLIAYLQWQKEIPDPATRLAEQAVENAAALELAMWETDEVFAALLEVALPHPLSGMIEALGRFKRPEAMPYFIRSLEDDVCRTAAEEALRQLGKTAISTLIGTSLTKLPSEEEESPSSLRRRTSALRLLSELDLPPYCWPRLRPLLSDANPAVVIAVSRIATRCGTADDRAFAVKRLLDIVPTSDWFSQIQMEECLVSLYAEHAALMEAEFMRNNALPNEQRVANRVLRTLLRVRRRVRGET